MEILSFSYADSALIGYTDPKDSRTYLCCNDERKQKVKGGCDIGRVIAPKVKGNEMSRMNEIRKLLKKIIQKIH